GGEIKAGTKLISSRDGLVDVVVDTKWVWVGADGRYYPTEEARKESSPSDEPPRKILVPEIVTRPARTLKHDTAAVSLAEVNARRNQVIELLRRAGDPRPDGQARSMNELFPDTEYIVHDAYRDVRVDYHADLHHDAPFL